jgi:hypothetical protein
MAGIICITGDTQMMIKTKSYLKQQFTQTLLVLMAATPLVVWANNPPEAEVSVPRGIQDIVQLIKEASFDIESRDKDIASLAQTPPTDASNQDKYVFISCRRKLQTGWAGLT